MKEIKIINKSTFLDKEIDVWGSAEQPLFRAKDVSENRKGGETVIAATTEVYDKMQDALAKNIRETLTDTNTREL